MRVARLLGAGAGPSGAAVPIPTDQLPAVSRRQLLTGLALLGAGAAAGTATGIAVKEITAQPAVPAPAIPAPAVPAALTAMTLHAQRVAIEVVGQEPGKLPPVGAPFTARGAVVDGAGASLGSFAITPLPGGAPGLQLHTFELEGGTLMGMGLATGGEGTFAIIGGTGRYQAAGGTYTARVGADRNGRPTAQFDLSLRGE